MTQLTTAERMDATVAHWERMGDKRAVFLGCYAQMTHNMLVALEAGEFQDAAWVMRLLDHFADYYFHALDAYDAETGDVPPVWRVAHDATRDNSALAVSLLLLGVNAHINYDLILAVADILEPEWAGLADEGRLSRYTDFCHVNAVISRTVDSVQDTILDRYEPIMELVDKALGPVDEWLVTREIANWRDHVWTHAVQRVEAQHAAEREALRKEIEAAAMRWARLFEI